MSSKEKKQPSNKSVDKKDKSVDKKDKSVDKKDKSDDKKEKSIDKKDKSIDKKDKDKKKKDSDKENKYNKFCVHHSSELVYYCESCEEPICRNCTKLGPHNNQLHRINTLEEAYKSRVSNLSELIKGNLLQKRDQLLAQIHRIEYRIEEIKYIKQIIERDVRNEYASIIENLKQAEGKKLAILQHEMAELQKDLDKINDLGNSFSNFVNNPNDPVSFLINAQTIHENIEFLVAKPFKTNIDVYPYDLPRQLTDLRLQLQKADAQNSLIEFKNQIIWKLLEDRKKTEIDIKQNMENAANNEIAEWAKLTDKFAQELQKYSLVCYYCGVPMEYNSVNKKCAINVKLQEETFQGYTLKVPDAKYNGNHRHFFSKPKGDLVDLLNEGKQLETINQIQFIYIITEIIGIKQDEADQLRKFFDPKNTNQIIYEDVLEVFNDPSLVDQIYEKY
ncbi:hypothetical protein IMG5_162440 [Ichthyophthirius multifiliis]|uniref:B box-type domain-containing protein n=1 Tax=Ichthyophthirius multifiliis TaxID=5932 RepID=G0R081_ICHMU|nr:hypothetical protein IMG5_162440 [Ichthyophthirius multifiliis]EGR29141.1 hypothetical protein IMG5_162440 [Ichthyophthirius multifiliis]|eukprot:XP_004030377.1 hypothetical protein IMG5_162440 [Ichthyophthirius multifiliis]